MGILHVLVLLIAAICCYQINIVKAQAQPVQLQAVGADGILFTPPGGTLKIGTLDAQGNSLGADRVVTAQQLQAAMDNMTQQLSSMQSTLMAWVTATLTNESTGYVDLPTFATTMQNYMTSESITNTYVNASVLSQTYATKTDIQNSADARDVLERQIIAIGHAVGNISTEFPLCPSPPTIANSTATDHIEHAPGTFVTYRCTSGFKMFGAPSILCLSNGTWSGVLPRCVACPTTWVNVSTALSDYRDIVGPGAFVFAGGRDYRSGEPRQTSSFNLQPVAVTAGGITAVYFRYSYVVGFGTCGTTCTNNGPQFSVYIVNNANPTQRVLVYASPRLQGYDYDTCSGWGSDAVVGDGCYSPMITVYNTSIAGSDGLGVLRTATSVYMRFEFQNNDRNMHLNDDGMDMRIRALECPLSG
eukprot:m.1211215 g.1211215  ORF g.1211215 m.1211215 type:complete len:416 (-) comp24593_c1_seq31:3901-5148(-)